MLELIGRAFIILFIVCLLLGIPLYVIYDSVKAFERKYPIYEKHFLERKVKVDPEKVLREKVWDND